MHRYTLKEFGLIVFIFISLVGCTTANGFSAQKDDSLIDAGNNIGNLMSMGLVSCDVDNIYYNHISDDSIWITKLDKSGNRTKLFEGDGWYLNAIEDWLYYVNSDDNKIYRCNINGENAEKASDMEVYFLYAYQGLFYVITSTGDAVHNLYTMNYDGTDLKPICDDKIVKIYISGNSIYYYTFDSEKTSIYKMNLDGSDKQEIKRDKDEDIYWFCVYENNIYYVGNNNAAIMKLDINSGVVSKVESTEVQYGGIMPDYIVSNSNTIVYCEMGGLSFKKLNLDTEDTNILYKPNLTGNINVNSALLPCLSIVGEDIYYYWNGKLNKINLNGGSSIQID